MTRRCWCTVTLALLTGAANAMAGHAHAEIKPWGPVVLTPTPSTAFPIALNSVPVDLSFNDIVIPLPTPPASSVPGAFYEISDITFIKATFHLDEGGDAEFRRFSADGVSPTNAGPYFFNTAITTRVFTFNTHDSGATEHVLLVTFPNPSIDIALDGFTSANAGVSSLEGLTLEISGNHYYLIPSPGALALLGLATIIVTRRRRA